MDYALQWRQCSFILLRILSRARPRPVRTRGVAAAVRDSAARFRGCITGASVHPGSVLFRIIQCTRALEFSWQQIYANINIGLFQCEIIYICNLECFLYIYYLNSSWFPSTLHNQCWSDGWRGDNCSGEKHFSCGNNSNLIKYERVISVE